MLAPQHFHAFSIQHSPTLVQAHDCLAVGKRRSHIVDEVYYEIAFLIYISRLIPLAYGGKQSYSQGMTTADVISM